MPDTAYDVVNGCVELYKKRFCLMTLYLCLATLFTVSRGKTERNEIND